MANKNPVKKFKKGDPKPPKSGMKKGYRYPHTIVRDIIKDCVQSGTYTTLDSIKGIVYETLIARGLLKPNPSKGDLIAVEIAKWFITESNFFNEVKPADLIQPGADAQGLIQGNNIQMLYFSNRPPQELQAGQLLQPDKQVNNGSATVLPKPTN